MNSKIRFGRIVIILIALLGVAVFFIFLGKKNISMNIPVVTTSITTNHTVATKTEPTQENTIDPNTYKNDTYGFGTIFLAKAEAATECSLDAHMAYDPIKEYVFADQVIQCSPTSDNSELFYNKQGGQLETMVFDLKKCHDAVKDRIEERFCIKYDKSGVTSGKSTGKWPTGTWTKSGDYVTFYLDLTLGKNEHWKSDYKFLMLDR